MLWVFFLVNFSYFNLVRYAAAAGGFSTLILYERRCDGSEESKNLPSY